MLLGAFRAAKCSFVTGPQPGFEVTHGGAPYMTALDYWSSLQRAANGMLRSTVVAFSDGCSAALMASARLDR